MFHRLWAATPKLQLLYGAFRCNTLHVCQRRGLNTGGIDLWPNALLVTPMSRPRFLDEWNKPHMQVILALEAIPCWVVGSWVTTCNRRGLYTVIENPTVSLPAGLTQTSDYYLDTNRCRLASLSGVIPDLFTAYSTMIWYVVASCGISTRYSGLAVMACWHPSFGIDKWLCLLYADVMRPEPVGGSLLMSTFAWG